ncbi:hypothetical protein CRUP_025826 [Coryphaenoides rupestris]|nr:hypothetical protein CRUP_025826 [Coryphaenoides rupestris]
MEPSTNDKTKLCRFLCYGSEEDTYTPREDFQPRAANAVALLSLLQDGRGCEVVEEAKRFAEGGRGGADPDPDPCLFALALCSQHSELRTRQAAFKALKEVCREPRHLFAFVQYKKELQEGMKCGMWGRALRKAVSDWYNGQDALSLAAAKIDSAVKTPVFLPCVRKKGEIMQPSTRRLQQTTLKCPGR